MCNHSILQWLNSIFDMIQSLFFFVFVMIAIVFQINQSIRCCIVCSRPAFLPAFRLWLFDCSLSNSGQKKKEKSKAAFLVLASTWTATRLTSAPTIYLVKMRQNSHSMIDQSFNSNESNLDNTDLVCVAQLGKADVLGFTWMPRDSGHRLDETRIFIRVCVGHQVNSTST